MYYLCTAIKQKTIANNQKNGDVAQLVEQRTENPCVDGSIPPITTSIRWLFKGFIQQINLTEIKKHLF